MSWLPIVFKPTSRKICVLGCGLKAQRKIRFLLRFSFPVTVFHFPGEELPSLEGAELKELASIDDITPELFKSCFLSVAAAEPTQNAVFAAMARACGVPVHIAEDVDGSDFLFPSLIERGPISIAVSSSGQHPTLTRLVRSRIESILPARLGDLSALAVELRSLVREKLPQINRRRAFWEKHFEGRVADLVFSGRDGEARKLLLDSLSMVANETSREVGEVYLVGAGPGDPDLLSFKALRLMRQADVVLYDRLVSPQILNLVRQDADMIDVGKQRANHTLPQDGINELLASLALQGKRVLRLKGGDPFIFGRGGEEIETLAKQGVPFQVVPGITAAAGCASYSGIPLTHRDYAQSVRFVTGHLKNGTTDLDWQSLIAEQQTLVFYMGLVGLPAISENLIKHGMKESMPLAVISKGTLPDQRVLISTLKEAPLEVSKANLSAPTIIIIGEVVRLHDQLQWSK